MIEERANMILAEAEVLRTKGSTQFCHALFDPAAGLIEKTFPNVGERE